MVTLTEVLPCFSSVVGQMPGYNPQERGTARTLPNFCVVLYIFCGVLCIFVVFYVFLCCSMYYLFCVVLCIVCVYMCTVRLPPCGYPIAVKYNISYQLRPLYPEKEPRYLFPRALGGLQSRSGSFKGREEILTLQGFQPRPAQSIVQSLNTLR